MAYHTRTRSCCCGETLAFLRVLFSFRFFISVRSDALFWNLVRIIVYVHVSCPNGFFQLTYMFVFPRRVCVGTHLKIPKPIQGHPKDPTLVENINSITLSLAEKTPTPAEQLSDKHSTGKSKHSSKGSSKATSSNVRKSRLGAISRRSVKHKDAIFGGDAQGSDDQVDGSSRTRVTIAESSKRISNFLGGKRAAAAAASDVLSRPQLQLDSSHDASASTAVGKRTSKRGLAHSSSQVTTSASCAPERSRRGGGAASNSESGKCVIL